MTVVRKSVAIHPLIDMGVRKVWARLIEAGFDASYSTALNYMLLLSILEAEKGLTEEVAGIAVSFLNDSKTIEELNMEDSLSRIYEKITKEAVNKMVNEARG